MKIRLCALGADDSLSVIQNVAKDFNEIEFIPIVYWEEDEIPEKVHPFISEADMWLCSGQVPYAIVKQKMNINAPVFYTRHSGEGLYKVLLYLVHEQGLKVSDISFDTLREDTMQQLLHTVGIDTEIHLKHYDGSIHSDELVAYHKALWESGMTKVAVTCLRSAEIKLKKLGIPSVHITPTEYEVRQTLDNAVQTHELLAMRNAQLVVQLIELVSLTTVKSGSLENVDKAIHRYAHYLHGTEQQVSQSRWAVYATRGSVEDITDNFVSQPRFGSIAKMEDEDFIGGIGLGKTIHDAENRAKLALSEAQMCGHGSWACAFENNTLIAPMGNHRQTLSYTFAREDLQRLSNGVALSGLTLTKIASILEKKGTSFLTAYELAEYLHVLPRSARRILLKMEEFGLATVVGEETSYQRGRPRKIYKINLK